MTEPRLTEDRKPGAIERLETDDASRKKFLKMVGSGGAASFAIFLAACGSKKSSSSTAAATAATSTGSSSGSAASDLKILNYALTLEYLEAAFYKDAIASGLVTGAAGKLAKKFGDSENQHVQALTATIKKLGGTPAAEPKSKFPLKDQKSILTLAATVENIGAAAYLGQAGNIQNADVLAAALSIHAVEARHAATLNKALGMSPTPDGAFGKPMSMAQVLPLVKPFIVG